MQHVVELGVGQIANRGKPGHELLEVRDHRGDLGLLQHDLGDPDPIGAGVLLPGQVSAPC